MKLTSSLLPIATRVEQLPDLWAINVSFPRPHAGSPDELVPSLLRQLTPGQLRGRRVAITAGSRGIRDISTVIGLAVKWLREQGAEPVVVAAMGSHGGATSEGQRKLLAHLGIAEESLGAPILSGMDVVELGRTPGGLVAYCDRNAAQCDGILVINRVKPHTAFAEPFGSGLLKMLAVGLGKVQGASQIHRQGPVKIAQAIEDIARVFISTGKVLGGLAIIENAYEETAKIVAVRPAEMIEKERVLFQEARSLMPQLPVEDVDVLIVDEMGKNYSGTGMDVNVIGRWRMPGMAEPSSPRIKRIVALRLSPESEGNAQGVGLADFVTQALVDTIDPVNTYVNTITSTYVERAFIPITLPTDREAIVVALASLAMPDPAKARIVRVRNTLHLEEMCVSEALLPDVQARSGVTVGASAPLRFTEDGTLKGIAGSRFPVRGSRSP